jgi:hypothetical protein
LRIFPKKKLLDEVSNPNNIVDESLARRRNLLHEVPMTVGIASARLVGAVRELEHLLVALQRLPHPYRRIVVIFLRRNPRRWVRLKTPPKNLLTV